MEGENTLQMKILEVKNLTFKVGDKILLKDVNLSINEAEYILLNGLNGSGKSTFLKILANDIDSKLYHKFELKGIVLDSEGNNILLPEKRQEFSKKICYVPQEDYFLGSTILEEFQISLNLANIDDSKENVYQLMDELRLVEILKSIDKKTSEKDIKKIYSLNPNKLSGGQKKLVSILSVVLRSKNCQLCLIDEPLNNLDIEHVRAICNLLTYINQELKKAIVLVSHCRVFPKVTSVYSFLGGELNPTKNEGCFSCFGKPNEQGYYD